MNIDRERCSASRRTNGSLVNLRRSAMSGAGPAVGVADENLPLCDVVSTLLPSIFDLGTCFVLATYRMVPPVTVHPRKDLAVLRATCRMYSICQCTVSSTQRTSWKSTARVVDPLLCSRFSYPGSLLLLSRFPNHAQQHSFVMQYLCAERIVVYQATSIQRQVSKHSEVLTQH